MNLPDLTPLKSVLQSKGLAAGLALMNERVAHRYTAIFEFRSGAMHNVALHDKAGELTPDAFEVVPITDSFCQFVLKDGSFQTHDTSLDGRLDGHKYKGVLLSYHGVPLLNNYGDLYGTMCHFDFASHKLEDEEYAYFQKAALLIPGYLNRTEKRS